MSSITSNSPGGTGWFEASPNMETSDTSDLPNNASDVDSGYLEDFDTELDGDEADPIVVCGLSIKFPQEATSAEGLWKMMMERKCAMTEFPPDRINSEGFYNAGTRLNTIPVQSGHFVKEDLAVFDADFFSLPPTEAASIDPMQRWLLEAAYRALENAGIPMESVSGSRTAVYTGSFGFDYMLQLCRDPENPPTYAALGFGMSMLANRLSWFFNLRGPSIGLDSACSSSAMAVDIGCQALRNGSCDMAMIAGCNTANCPESYTWMSNINFLSPDGRCHSFDHRANGYARGEGVAVLLLKRLSDALRDGNTIRAVIRSTGSNEDGRTPGITQPSRTAQQQLIKETYEKAGLSMAHTRFFEAHGTGTAIGDPREAQAIGSVFRKFRSADDPLYVYEGPRFSMKDEMEADHIISGALKSNIGHLEGASGLAALVKAILVLEKGIIPPNTNFEKLNPKIDAGFLKLKFPTKAHIWPTNGLRRASINSFGYGGANSHIVIDDAYNYLRLRSLPGRHSTIPFPRESSHGLDREPGRDRLTPKGSESSKLLIWSSADKNGIARMTVSLQNWYKLSGRDPRQSQPNLLEDLALTLDSHRSHLQWRSFALVKSKEELSDLRSRISSPVRIRSKPPRLGFVFSGQGAQWAAMGKELLEYPSFRFELEDADNYLRGIGCQWSIQGELLKGKEGSRIDEPELSQTLCTVLQVALVNLLHSFGVMPSAAVGHSSGEIAAAYACGYISLESAWQLAYYRGICSTDVVITSNSSHSKGAMMSVGLSEDRAMAIVASLNRHASEFGICIACVNSPANVTIAGESRLIDELKHQLDEMNVFARKVRVPVAYHSRQMESVSEKYQSLIQSISKPESVRRLAPMISSVTGKLVTEAQLLDPSYWALNMTSPVLFTQAITTMCEKSSTDIVKKIDGSHSLKSVVDHLIELGAHATLQGPLREILQLHPRGKAIGYTSILKRGHSAVETTLSALGDLYCMGYSVNLRKVNSPSEDPPSGASPSLVVDLPEYPFDHSQRYWEESRLSRNYRLRSHAPTQLLGVRSRDWNPLDARWRNFLRVAEMPWAEQHVINGATLYPATGMLVMAIEGAKQLTEPIGKISGFTLRDVRIESPMNLDSPTAALEVQTNLRTIQLNQPNERAFEFAVRTWSNDEWILNCQGTITVELSTTTDSWVEEKKEAYRRSLADSLESLRLQCLKPVDADEMYSFLEGNGYKYGPVFRAARQQLYNSEYQEATAEVPLFQAPEERHVIHPVSLDAILHLSFTAFSRGASKPMATSIPARIGRLWVSDTGLSYLDNDNVTACTKVQNVTRRGFTCTGGVLSRDSPNGLSLWYDDIELVNITSEPTSATSLPNPKQFCMNVECKVALSKLGSAQIQDLLRDRHPISGDLSDFYHDVRVLVLMTIERLVKTEELATLKASKESWQHHYWIWAEHNLKQCHCGCFQDHPDSDICPPPPSYEDLLQKVSNVGGMGRVYGQVARDLVSMFNGQINPLESLLESGLLRGGYDEWAQYDCAKQAAIYIDLLAHQTPGMNILEVGAGTGATTRNFTNALRSESPDALQSLRCNQYDFTDISPVFCHKAQEEFVIFKTQMSFKTLDLERGFADQGFMEGSYDVVVADNVLHVTSDLANALRNVRKALRPGGKLIMHELLKPTGWTAGFIFGVFPGWWLGANDGRVLSPNLTPEGWDAVLKESGFSGADIVLRDFDSEVAHQVGWIVATAVDVNLPKSDCLPRQLPQTTDRAIIVIDESSEDQRSLSDDLMIALQSSIEPGSTVMDFSSAQNTEINERTLVILLLDYGPSFLAGLNETSWDQMSRLIHKSRRLLWVSAGGGRHAIPDHGLLDGLARTLRAEYYDLHLVTAALELPKNRTRHVSHLMQIAQEMFSRPANENYEEDYTEIDGLLHTKRLIEAAHLKATMNQNLMPYQVLQTPLNGKTRFEVSTSRGLTADYLPHYRISQPAQGIQTRFVEILVKAVSLLPSDRTTLLRGQEDSSYGNYCTGVVLSSDKGCTFQPGDRVLAAQTGLFRSHVVVSSQHVVKIPATLSFNQACVAMPRTISAYNGFIEAGRVKHGESILVQDAASPIGRALIRCLKDHGAKDIWATTSTKEEEHWLTDTIGIPEHKVLPDSWFGSDSMFASQWKRKFPIIFIAGSNPQLKMLDFVRSDGRIVTIGASSTINGYRQGGSPTAENIRLVTIPLEAATPESLSYAAAISASCSDILKDETPFFKAAELTSVFTSLQSLKENNMVVVEFDEADIVDVRDVPNFHYSLEPAATYVIAGGFGGLGRAIAAWLVSRGARHLLLLSRSGPRTTEAQELLTELAHKQVQVESPCCDVSDRNALRAVLENCAAKMPPIKGCIQSSMVMTERIFQQMKFRDWKATVDGKAKGSWNLHAELPCGLDFFILLSSIMGILGTGSLSAYNAGNTYQDALARYRVSQGENAIALDLGGVPDAGYLVDHLSELKNVQQIKKHGFTYTKEVCALLEIFCDPQNAFGKSFTRCQPIVGLRPPAHWRHLEEVPFTMSQPFWGHMHYVPPLDGTEEEGSAKRAVREQLLGIVDRITSAESVADAAEIVRGALMRRFSSLSGLPEDRLDDQKPMHQFGIDSLSAIEIRNWVGKIFNVDMPVFDILGGVTFASASASIAHKVRQRE